MVIASSSIPKNILNSFRLSYCKFKLIHQFLSPHTQHSEVLGWSFRAGREGTIHQGNIACAKVGPSEYHLTPLATDGTSGSCLGLWSPDTCHLLCISLCEL